MSTLWVEYVHFNSDLIRCNKDSLQINPVIILIISAFLELIIWFVKKFMLNPIVGGMLLLIFSSRLLQLLLLAQNIQT